MPCDPEELQHVPLFALLDNDEIAVLAAQVDLKTFAPRQRIYKIGDPGKHAYILLAGNVQVSTVDEDHQEVLVDHPGHGRNHLRRDQPGRHCNSAAAQTPGRYGYADRTWPPISRLAATGTASR